MESWLVFFTQHAPYAHWVIFGALILAGFNLPISEDLMLILSGVLASTVVPEHTWHLFIGVFLGCYLSDWIAYGLGWHFGPRLLRMRWFASKIPPSKVQKITSFFEKYGFWTLLIGRFIPFGVRNCLFITAGMGKMSRWRFGVSDGIACLISNTTLFTLAYLGGKNLDFLLAHLKTLNIIIFLAFVVTALAFLLYRKKQQKRSRATDGVSSY